MISKEGKPTDQRLEQILFFLNSHRNDEGSPAERFFRRGPRTGLPNSITRELNHRDLIQNRHAKQEKLARAKGHTSRDVFKIGDKVVLQDPVSRKWKSQGTIVEAREADDGTNHSFQIRLEAGGETLRHKRHIRHDTASMPVLPKKVQFSFPDATLAMAGPGVVTRSRATLPKSA